MRGFEDTDDRTAVRIGDTFHNALEMVWVLLFWIGLFVLPTIAATSAYLTVGTTLPAMPTYAQAVLQVGSAFVALLATVAVMLGIAWLADTPQAGDRDE